MNGNILLLLIVKSTAGTQIVLGTMIISSRSQDCLRSFFFSTSEENGFVENESELIIEIVFYALVICARWFGQC